MVAWYFNGFIKSLNCLVRQPLLWPNMQFLREVKKPLHYNRCKLGAITHTVTHQFDDNNYGHERPLWNSPVPFLFIASIIYIFISIAFCRVFLASWTHWGPVTHICVNNLTTIGPVNGLLPGRRQAITWTNAGVLLIVPLETNFSEILIEISTFSFKKMRLKVSSAK